MAVNYPVQGGDRGSLLTIEELRARGAIVTYDGITRYGEAGGMCLSHLIYGDLRKSSSSGRRGEAKLYLQYDSKYYQDTTEIWFLRNDLLILTETIDYQKIARVVATELANALGDAESGFIGAITNSLETAQIAVFDTASEVSEAAAKEITELADSAIAETAGLAETVSAWLESSFVTLGETAESAIETVQEFIAGTTDDLSKTIDDIGAEIAESFGDTIAIIDTVIERTNSVLTEWLEPILDDIGFFTEGTRNVFESLAASAWDILDDPAAYSSAQFGPFIALIGSLFTSGARQVIDEGKADAIVGIPETLTRALNLSSDPTVSTEDFFAGVFDFEGVPSMYEIAMAALVAIGGLIGTVFASTKPGAEIALRDYSKLLPWQQLSIGDLLNGMFRGNITTSEYFDWGSEHGFDQNKLDILWNSSNELLLPLEMLRLWLRGELTDVELEERLHEKRFDNREIEELKKLTFYIPPVNDLILMAVREVFTPAIAAKFGQFEDFPQEFADQARKQGLSEEWAQNYWAAHWSLPSLLMGYRMFHRRVIDEAELKMLMRAQDVMPGWRDRLLEISYNPLTRVDVRRMHKLGVLNREQVTLAYRDRGFSPDNAELMTLFTEEYNADADPIDDSDFRSLTRSQVVNMYSEGILDRGDVTEMLLLLGYSNSSTELIIIFAEIEEQRQERKEQSGLIIDKFRAGIMAFETAQDRINGIGLQSAEVDKAMTRLIRAQDVKNKTPNEGDLKDMFDANIITLDTYKTGLSALGYAPFWISAFTGMAKG